MPKLLTPEEITTRLAELAHWTRVGSEIEREFHFPGFPAAIAFVNAVATLSEEANHHPDIDIRWNKVRLRLSTHSQGGLTNLDFDLAARIDEVA